MTWKPEAEQIRARRTAATAQGGKNAVSRQHAKGRLTIRERIEALIDEGSFDEIGRGAGEDGMIVVTAGLRAMGQEFLAEAASAVATFDGFSEENDPHGEHDFGALTVQCEKLLFKIDYYDLAMSAHSPDPADPKVTRRVLTIMLANEY